MQTLVRALALGAALSFAPTIAFTQTTVVAAPVAAPMVVGANVAPVQMLRAGTSIPLRTITPLTTEGKKLKVGQRFDLETTEPISVNGQVVIPAGSRAVGEITDVRNKGMWGKSGRIGARLVYVQAGDRRLRLSGSMDDKGVTGTGGVVASVLIVPVVGFFVTGTSAAIAPGSNATGFLEEDLAVQFAQAAPAPLIVAASAPTASLIPGASASGEKSVPVAAAPSATK